MAKPAKKNSKHRQKDRQKTVKVGKNDKEIKYLNKLIDYSLRYSTTSSEALNTVFLEQVERLKGKIRILKENQ